MQQPHSPTSKWAFPRQGDEIDVKSPDNDVHATVSVFGIIDGLVDGIVTGPTGMSLFVIKREEFQRHMEEHEQAGRILAHRRG